jgi:glutaredoxin-like protein
MVPQMIHLDEKDALMTQTIIIYGTTWCGDCRRTRRFLDYHKVPYEYIDIDQDKDAEQFVMRTNGGMRSVPTIVCPDGSVMVEPSNLRVAEKLGLPT